jgi:hypothetical protein
MSKRHQATRRRAYGRRQHELHQRHDESPLTPWEELVEEVHDAPSGVDRSPDGSARSRRLAVGLGD